MRLQKRAGNRRHSPTAGARGERTVGQTWPLAVWRGSKSETLLGVGVGPVRVDINPAGARPPLRPSSIDYYTDFTRYLEGESTLEPACAACATEMRE